jgi:hypothetical protein
LDGAAQHVAVRDRDGVDGVVNAACM